MDNQKNEDASVIDVIYKVLGTFGEIMYITTGDGVVSLKKDDKVFGIILEKEIYLRVKPQLFFFYPRETYSYYGVKFRRMQLKSPVDKDGLLREIHKGYAIACE